MPLVDECYNIKNIFKTQLSIGVRKELARHFLHKADAWVKTHLPALRYGFNIETLENIQACTKCG